jgi:bifunctional non-homologous end joining protein LigD
MTAQPDWIVPMAATLTQDRFTGGDWIFERKYDGIRLLAFRRGSEVQLFSRNHLPQNLPKLASAIADLPVSDAILDGELLWGAESGYHVFDLPYLNGRDFSSHPLDERRAALNALPFAPPLYHVGEVFGEEPWTRACSEGWEGVIAKRRDSPYEQKRSKHWLKMKCELSQEFLVGGFTDPQGARVGLGALLVGHMEGDDFVFAGKVGTGFDTQLLLGLRDRLEMLRVETTPFTKATGLPRVRMHWVKPAIQVHVAFIEWTVHRKLRHSRLLGVRDVAR